MMDLTKKDALIGVGVAVGAAVLVIFLRGRNSASTGGNISGGVTDIMGGFQTADTVFVPTSSYDIQYNTYKGAVTYSTVTNNNQSTTTTTYSDISGTVTVPPQPIPDPPHITTGSGSTVNPPTTQTGTTPAAPAPTTPTPATPSQPLMMGDLHYTVPKGGWNPNSVVDYIKSKGGYADMASRTKLASEMGIKNYTGTAAQNIQMLNALKAKYH